MKKTYIAAVLIIFVSLAGAYSVRKYNQRDPVFDLNQPGKIAPGFSLPNISGGQLKLEDYKGQLVLLNFWASWCPPCRAEIPGFIKVQNKYKDKPFTFVGVAIEDKEAVSQYSKEIGINYPVSYGVEASHDLASRYGNPDGALPYSILISPEQKIIEVFSGFLSENKLEELINKNL